MSTETIAILRAICDQIEDAISRARETITPKVISEEEVRDWRGSDYPDRRLLREGPSEADPKRKVTKFWPQLVPLANLQKRVYRYMEDVEGKR